MKDFGELRVGLDADALRLPLSGVGRYVFELCVALERLLPLAEFYAYSRLPRECLMLPSDRWRLRQEPIKLFRRLPSFLWLITRGKSFCNADKLQVFWAGRTLHPCLGDDVITVATVHDLNHLLVPKTMQFSTRLSHRIWFDRHVRHADVVLTNSIGTASRLRALLGRESDGVVLPGIATRFKPATGAGRIEALELLTRIGVQEPYLLSVATLEPRKNVSTLFHAFIAMKRAGELPANQQLVLAGAKGWQNPALERELLAASNYGVLVAGYVPDEFMPALYACADALVCPSLYEGFGMPVLEARACGTRLVISDLPELLEAAGADATIVQPTLEGVRGGIRHALSKTPRIEAGILLRYSWNSSAESFLVALEEKIKLRST